MNIFIRIWYRVTWVFRLVLPIFSKARDFRGISSAVRWTIHVIVVLAILLGLLLVNKSSGRLGVWLKQHLVLIKAEWFRGYWLPVFGLVVYLLLMLAWLLWKLLGMQEPESDFDDIDRAWDEAVAALDKAGIDLRDTPLFLVVGHSAGGEDALFAAAQVSPIVNGAPERANSPLHVYANRDAVYVTCAGASVLGHQAGLLTGDPAAAAPSGGGAAAPAGYDPNRTMAPGIQEGSMANPMKDIQRILARAEREGRSPAQLVEEERKRIQIAERKSKARPPLDLKEADRSAARLRHLCRLIVRDRYPYCPINGILLLVPFSSSDSDRDADQTATACQRDMAAARKALQLHCPMFTVICDLETATGFREFLQRLPPGDRQRRVGQRFPLATDLEPDKVADKVDESVQWIFRSLIPYWVYKMFRVETPGKNDAADVLRGNAELYQLLSELRIRQARLGRIAARAVGSEKDGPPLFGGTYLAGTGTDPAEQAFSPGILRRLADHQASLCWSASALDEEDWYGRWTRFGYIFISVLVCAAVAAAILVAVRGGGSPPTT